MKRFITGVLVLCVAVGISVPVFAAVPQKIKSLHASFAQQLTVAELDDVPVSQDDLSNLVVHAGSRLCIFLQGEEGESLFFDQNGAAIPTADLSLARLRAAQIALEQPYGDAADVVESVQISGVPGGVPYLQVQFQQEFFSTEDLPFSFSLQLSMAGKALDETALQLSGVMRTVQREVYAQEDPIDLRDGVVIQAAESISQAQLLLGEGVTITANLRQGEKYYGVATVETVAAAQPGTPPQPYRLYTLQVIHLDEPGSRVRIDSDVTLHVYNAKGEYLGTTRSELAYSDQYVLTTRRAETDAPQ